MEAAGRGSEMIGHLGDQRTSLGHIWATSHDVGPLISIIVDAPRQSLNCRARDRPGLMVRKQYGPSAFRGSADAAEVSGRWRWCEAVVCAGAPAGAGPPSPSTRVRPGLPYWSAEQNRCARLWGRPRGRSWSSRSLSQVEPEMEKSGPLVSRAIADVTSARLEERGNGGPVVGRAAL